MATKLYLSRAGADVTLAAGTYTFWDSPAAGSVTVRKLMDTQSGNFAASTYSQTNAVHNAVVDNDVCNTRFLSGPLVGDQTITGTLKGQVLSRESATTLNAHNQMTARVVSNDGQTVRGTLYAGDTRTGTVDELITTLRNQKNPAVTISPVTLSSVAGLDGDRILVELGHRANATTTGNTTISVGTNAAFGGADDLVESGAETTNFNPWVEFSQNLVFVAAATTSLPLQSRTSAYTLYRR